MYTFSGFIAKNIDNILLKISSTYVPWLHSRSLRMDSAAGFISFQQQ